MPRITTLCKEAMAAIGPVSTVEEVQVWISKNYKVVTKTQVSQALSRMARTPGEEIARVGGPRSSTFTVSRLSASRKKSREKKSDETFQVEGFIKTHQEEEFDKEYVDVHVVLGVSAWLVKNWAASEPHALDQEDQTLLDLIEERTSAWLMDSMTGSLKESKYKMVGMLTSAAAILYESALEFAMVMDPNEEDEEDSDE